MLDDLTSSLHDGMSLDSTAIEGAIDAMVREEHSAEQKAAFLTALAKKGETVEEISGFACGLRAMAIAPPIDRSLRDEPFWMSVEPVGIIKTPSIFRRRWPWCWLLLV